MFQVIENDVVDDFHNMVAIFRRERIYDAI